MMTHKTHAITPRLPRGVTLIEIIAASVIGTLLAGGTMMAFVLAAKNARTSLIEVEAAGLAQQTLEKYRNKIACDSGWYAPADPACDPTTLPLANTDDALLPGTPLLEYGGTRKYTVTQADCDGNLVPGDCLQVKVKVEWNPL